MLGFLLPRLKWAAKFSSEVEVVEHAEHKKGNNPDWDFQVSRRQVAPCCRERTLPFLPDRHQPCLQTPPPSSSHPAKIGPNSTTVELNSLKFKWEMSFHWSCKYWKWARVENWVNVCAFKSSAVKREVASGFLWPIKDFFASTLNLWNKADGGQISISDGCSA